MRRNFIRMTVFLIYTVVTFGISFSFSGAGHGSFAPMSVFYSWARLLLEFGIVPETFLFPITIFLLYLATLFAAGTLLSKLGKPKWYFMVLFFHMMGIVLSVVLVEHGHLVTKKMIVTSYVVSIPLSLLYYFLDYRLLTFSHKPFKAMS